MTQQYIYYFGAGSLHNLDSSVDGGKYIRLPLMRELLRLGKTVRWIGFDRNNNIKNNYLKLIGLDEHDYLIDLRCDVRNWSIVVYDETNTVLNHAVFDKLLEKEPGALFIELRPNLKKEGYNFETEWKLQLELIDAFYARGLKVFVWDQDVWAYDLPVDVRKKITLLRSYYEPLDNTFPSQELFLYGWSRFWFENKLYTLAQDKKFDVCYCGNVYGRRQEFLEYFEKFHQNNAMVCVQGNWLRKKYDDRDFALDNFPNFLFFGSTPHWSTLPSIALSKSVIQFSNESQQKVGLPTVRIFETLMGHSIVFCSSAIKHVDRVVPEELIFDSKDDLWKKWQTANFNKSWSVLRRQFESKLMTEEHSYAARTKQLVTWIDE